MMILAMFMAQLQTMPATEASAVDFTWLFIKMLLALGIVSVVAVLILKYAAPRLGLIKKFQHGGHFEVLGRYTLEPRKTLYLVKVGKKYLVIGAAEHAINLITEISEPESENREP